MIVLLVRGETNQCRSLSSMIKEIEVTMKKVEYV